MKQIDLSIKIKNTEFKNPIVTASGTFGYGNELSKFFDVKKIGGVVTKTITARPILIQSIIMRNSIRFC